MVKMFVTVDKHQSFKSFTRSNDIYQIWTLVQQRWEVSDFKIVGNFFKQGFDVFSCVMASESSATQLSIV